MAVYRLDRPRPLKKYRKSRRLIIIAICLVILAGLGYAGYLFLKKDTAPDNAVDSKVNNLGYYDPNQTFTTAFFTFKAAKTWRFEEKESTVGVFVYRSYQGSNVEQELVINVNKDPKDRRVMRVLPVTPAGSTFATGRVSDRCSSYLPKSNFTTNPADLVFDGAKYSCWVDNTQSYMGVSAVGGDSNITLSRSDGTSAVYFFRYLDSRFTANYQDAVTILGTFKAL